MMVTYIVALLVFGLVGSFLSATPVTEPDLISQQLKANTCGFDFPPPKVIPQNCAVKIPQEDLKDIPLSDKTVEIYLCLALLDVKTHICALKTPTSDFLKDIKLGDSQDSDAHRLCARMATLNSLSAQMKTLYTSLQDKCSNICSALDRSISLARNALCETLFKGHEIIQRLAALKKPVSYNGSSSSVTPPFDRPVIDSNNSKPQSSDPSLTSRLDNNGESQISNAPREKTGEDDIKQVSNVQNQLHEEVASKTKEGGANFNQPPIVQPDANLIRGSDGRDESKTQVDHESVKEISDDIQNGLIGNSDPHSEGTVSKALVEHRKDSSNIEKPLETDREEMIGSPNTNAAEDVEVGVGDDGNLQETNNPQNETDDDDDDDDAGVGEKEAAKVSKVIDSSRSIVPQNTKVDDVSKVNEESIASSQRYGYSGFVEAEDSHFFAYFMSLSAFFIICYLAYHNKRKIIAIAVEGKKGRSTGRRRPHSASYHKLDSNLEEAMSSNVTSTNSYVIY